ncbi:hypothetical protein cypCar_00043960 [Cyprinus carpio]|nr:hypothetical protein cypCar_00043960 [Cyprinus carpio]
MPSSSGSTRSLTCGCSSASCCTVSTYEKDGQVSASSPNLNSGVGYGAPTEAYSAPSLTSGLSRGGMRVIHPNELAKKLTHCPPGPSRWGRARHHTMPALSEFKQDHIRGDRAHQLLGTSQRGRRRPAGQNHRPGPHLLRQSKDSFQGDFFGKELVCSDESMVDPGRLTRLTPLQVVLESLRREGKDPIVLKGGLAGFRQSHDDLCEHSLHLEEGQDGSTAVGLSGALPHSLPSTPDIENAELTAILPFLYLGNERDAQDLELMQHMDIGFILNVTTHLPLYHYELGLFKYKRLPASDSNKQNLRQYFEEAFEFNLTEEEAHQAGSGLLIHCQAGVSRSATIVIAYLMKHTWMTMTDAYKFVKSRRPIISPNLNFMGQLLEFEEDLNNGITPRILTPKLTGLETVV